MGVSGEWFCWNWSGGVETTLEADARTKVFGHHWGGRPHPMGVEVVLIQWVLNPANTPANQTPV